MKRFSIWFLIGMFLLFSPTTAISKLAPGDYIDIHGHWAESEIQAACNLGLMNGMGTTWQGYRLFSPEGTVNRAQLAVVLERTFQLDYGNIRFIKQPAASDYYQDVDDQTWYSEAVVMCSINQIFDSGPYFKPGDAVSRIELAQAVYRAFNAKGISVPMIMLMPNYEDTKGLTQEEVNAITFVSNTGIMKGDGQNFRPHQDVKRAELAKVLNRCSGLIVVDEGFNGQKYTLKVGQSFTLSLAGNQTTGYVWNLNESWDKTIISLVGRDYQIEGDGKLVGQGGREYFKFKALKPGSVEISLMYARPWESVQLLQKFNLKVMVTQAETDSTLQISTKEVKEPGDLINVDLNIPQISGLKKGQVQSALNKQFIQDATSLQASLTSEVSGFKEECDKGGYPFRPYEIVSRFPQYWENGKILSLYVDYYNYTGGAHGATERRPYNYELNTGKELALKDLFKEGYDYKSVINEEITREISSRPDDFFTGEMGFQGISDKQSYYVQNGCLVIYFAQYEIAPYAAGIPEFRIPLDRFAEGTNEMYLI